MKKAIREYIGLTNEEKINLWANAIFIFDTNVLLNLYRYSKNSSEELIEILESLKDRIWIPHQVADEFMKNRYSVIKEFENKYSLYEDSLKSIINNNLKNLIDETDTDELKEYINAWFHRCKEKNIQVTDPSDDKFLTTVLYLFDGKTGDCYSDSALDKHKQDGRTRYDKMIPPGFKDSNKVKKGKENTALDNNAYGDYIVWRQILDYAKQSKNGVIYITNDQKEDWWYKSEGETIGPRPELIKEFYEETNNTQNFHMYTMERFLTHYREDQEILKNKLDLNALIRETIKLNKSDYTLKDDILALSNSFAETHLNLFAEELRDSIKIIVDKVSLLPVPATKTATLFNELRKIDDNGDVLEKTKN